MADLFGTYSKRIKLTIDHTKIDADLSWFPVTVFLGNYGDAIDVGLEAIDRAQNMSSGYTRVNKDNAANASGKITSVEIYAATNMEGVIVATFSADGNDLTARDSYEIGSVTSGSKQTFNVELNIETGDYLGFYNSSGEIESVNIGGNGQWFKSGDNTECSSTAFTFGGGYFSLYATGFTGQGTEVFTEFDADEDFDRIAFTSSDGETQLYADCELFDVSEQKAIYHVSKTGWTVSSSTDTDIYLYYDNTADHNTTYISKSGDTAAQSVWDTNFKAVYHMNDPDLTGTDELDDDFEDNNLTEYTAGSHWATASDQKYAGTYSAKASGGEDTWSDRQLQFTLSESAKYIKYDFYWRCNDATGGKYYRIITNPLHLLEGGNTINTNFSYYTSGGSHRNLPITTSFVADTWYHIEVYHDTVSDFAMYWIDGNYKGKATDIETSDAITTVKFGNEGNSGVDSWFDDITVTVYDTPLYGIVDSTSNANHGTKKAYGEPVEATGLVGQGQDFDGTDDYIEIPDFSLFDGLNDFTVEAIVNADSVPASDDWENAPIILSFRGEGSYQITYDDSASNPDRLSSRANLSVSSWTTLVESTRQSIDTDYFHATTFDTTNGWVWYENGSSQDTNANTESFVSNSDANYIGWSNTGTNRHFNGLIDEVRISSTARSSAWIAATYDSLWDTLLTYGSEETESAEEATNVLFIFSNF